MFAGRQQSNEQRMKQQVNRRCRFLRGGFQALGIGILFSAWSRGSTTAAFIASAFVVIQLPARYDSTASISNSAATSYCKTLSHLIQKHHHHHLIHLTLLRMVDSTIVSPFDDSRTGDPRAGSTTTATTTTSSPSSALEGPLDLTWENVEAVLDEMRPYLIQDGGNVQIAEIDGPVVRLQLEGACGTCPSSTQTLKMGLERGLMEKIPEIQQVVQAMPEGPAINEEQVNVILDGVRPFLNVAGGSIELNRFEGLEGLQPTIWLHMKGASATLNSVKLEIAKRLQRHFMVAGLRVEWVE